MSETNTLTPRQPSSARGLDPIIAPPYRYTFACRGEEEDDHGSDDELRQAYRMLRAEEAAAKAKSTGMAAGEAAMAEESSPAPTAESGESRPAPGLEPPTALGFEPMGALLEADDGSTFVPVYPRASTTSSGPPLSRSARQSVELARPASQQPSFAMSQPGAGGQGYETQLASRKLGSRASFTAASSKQHVAPSMDEGSAEVEASRRHSLDQAAVAPRNYSLPQHLADRKNNTQYDMRESSDGFESVLEDAYAQTRACLPPSVSMPVMAPSTAARHDHGPSNNGTESAQAKKKKWWKP